MRPSAVRPTQTSNPHHMTHRTDDIREPGATAGLSAQRSVRDRSCQVSSRNLSAQSGDDSVSVLNSVLGAVRHWSRRDRLTLRNPGSRRRPAGNARQHHITRDQGTL